MKHDILAINDEIRRLIGDLDASLDGIPAEESAREHALTARAKQCNAKIVQLLAATGVPRNQVGTGTLPALRREAGEWMAERDARAGEAADVATRAAAVRAEIAGLDADIEAVKEKRKTLTSRINSLEAEIRNRCFVEDIWYWIFGDPTKDAKLRAEGNRKVVQGELDELLGTIRDKEERRNALAEEESDLHRKAAELGARIKDNECRQDAFRRAVATARENENALAELADLRERQEKRAAKRVQEGGAAAKALKESVEGILEKQPRLADLDVDGLGHSETFPDAFSFGRYRLRAGGNEWTVPRILPFPVPKALVFPSTADGTAGVREFLLRAFQCLPPDSLEITACDPFRMGASLNGFQGLLNNRKPIAGGKFPTVAPDIEAALARLHGLIESFLQQECTGDIHDWMSYNAAHPARPRTYRLLVMFDLPDQLTDAVASYLVKILENGPKCGILPLLTVDMAKLDPRRHAALKAAIDAFALNVTRLWNVFGGFRPLRNIRLVSEEPCAMPDDGAIAAHLSGLCADYAERDRFAGSLESVWQNEPLWAASSEDGLEATVGWDEESRAPVRFSLGDQPVHALLGGTSGSGKSNLLHVLLHSLCHRYSPQELNLYLLDYKEATEFNAYAHPLLPHAAGVATESDVEYGISVLRHLERERVRRSDRFKVAGVKDIREFRAKGGVVMPRILLVVDEFQRLFENAKAGAEAEMLFRNILKLGRAAGIHLLMATQTLNGLQNIVSIRTFLSQMACRLALKCTPEDSATLLAVDNLAAATLPGPPHGILNNDLGRKSANVRLCIPLADSGVCKRHLEALSNAAEGRGERVANSHVFSGTALPEPPSDASLVMQTARSNGLQIAIGRTADFEEDLVFADIEGRNLLAVVRQPGISSGLRRSIARGLAAETGTKEFILYSEHTEDWAALDSAGCSVVRVDDEWSCENLDGFAAGPAGHKVIVLDGFENLRNLKSAGYVSTRNGPSAAERLRALVERPKKSGVQLVALFRDYGRACQCAKEILQVCDLRIGDGKLSDPAKFLGFEGLGPREVPALSTTKAVLVDRDADEPFVFRPFA